MSFSTSNFYGLPKVHESKIIQEAIQVQNSEYIKINEPSDLTLRPIVAGPNFPTRRLSNLVDILLKPFLIHIKSYIKDNLDFLVKCSRENKRDTILTTFDVVGLYSNIPHKYGLEAIEYWLDKFPESLHPRFSKEFVLGSVKFILENNNLNFENEYFNQIKGMAMGTIFAPTYAHLTMGFFELTFYDLCRDKFGENLRNFIFENWSRFLDDCETLLEENKINPNELLSILKSINPSIQFTMEYSKDAIPFLDILIKRNNDNIRMDICYKPTDTHRCPPFSSNHPNHCKKNIPFTLARRICTIVENTEAKMKRLENLKINLSKYQYPKQLTEFSINKALSIPLQELRTPKTISNDNSLPFITTYNPNNPNVYEMIDKSVECLKRSKVDGFENLRVIKSKRQAPNLKKILTKAEFLKSKLEFLNVLTKDVNVAQAYS